MDGISMPEEIVLRAKEKGLRSIAITDHGHAHAHADIHLMGKKHGVRTLLGVEAYIIHSLKEWNELRAKMAAEKKAKGKKEADEGEEIDVEGEDETAKQMKRLLYRKGHLVILARNREGLSNLYNLTYKAHRDGMYSKPRCDKDMLREHARGLVTTSACMGGVISNKCWQFQRNEIDWSEVVREAEEFRDIFGKDGFYLELQFNESPGQAYINECLMKVARETKIPMTVTADSHYIEKDDWRIQEILYMLRSKKTLLTRGPDWRFDVKQLYIKSAPEMWESYKQFAGAVDERTAKEAFENTLLVDSMIENFEPDTHQRLPTLPYENPFKEMGKRAIDSIKARGLDKNPAYVSRIMHELKVIKEKGFSNYFLIMQQIVQRAGMEMLLGSGRGSAAGSLVCYALGITDLDPIEHDLMFERFLDPARVEFPDIDTDFEDPNRAKAILEEMFGKNNVASLSTYGTFQIKGLMKDLGRVYDIDHNVVNQVNKKIEAELRVLYKNQDKSTIVIKLEDIERVSPTFNEFVTQYPDLGRDMKRLYGRNRHIGRHACGLIIGDNLPSETAIFTSKGVVQTSFTEGIVNKNISAMGFVKFDLLSLATLKSVNHCLKLLAKKGDKTYEELKESIRPHNLDLNDIKVLKNVFWKGNYAGIFQFTEKGIRSLGKRIKPDSFEDVSACASLYRPGPLGSGMDKLFVKNKHHPEELKYDHPLLEDILSPTRGCIIYQEQLMKICNVMGKMSWKDVNRVRKVLLKKDKSKSEEFLKKEGDELSGKFYNGCVENGMELSAAKELWKNLLFFGGYGFNASHSKAYAVATMQCAYLATYHPLEFYSSVLTCSQAAELQDSVSDIKKAGVNILPVDINASKLDHEVSDNSIRLSLLSVKGVGPAAAEKIVANAPYTSFLDFLKRSGASKTSIVPLAQVNAFASLAEKDDDMGSGPGVPNIKVLLARYEAYTSFKPDTKEKLSLKDKQAMREAQYYSMRGIDFTQQEKIDLENELLGFAMAGSMFDVMDRDVKLDRYFGDILTEYNDFIDGENEVAMLPVLLKDFKERPQRNGQMFAFMKFMTRSGAEFEAPAFASTWKLIKPKAKKNHVYAVMFNRKAEDPQSLIVGKPGFKQTQSMADESFIDVDDLT